MPRDTLSSGISRKRYLSRKSRVSDLLTNRSLRNPITTGREIVFLEPDIDAVRSISVWFMTALQNSVTFKNRPASPEMDGPIMPELSTQLHFLTSQKGEVRKTDNWTSSISTLRHRPLWSYISRAK